MALFSAQKLLWMASVLVLLSRSVEAREIATFGEEAFNGDRGNPSGPSQSHTPWDPPSQPLTQRGNPSGPSRPHPPWDPPPHTRTPRESTIWTLSEPTIQRGG
ncbi:hypothetical protein FH972_017462 [Carpinus fangiana]|uniref:Uncharacterized protein n=1 Tax=Carpinus fangiana TaxID=176857 RepID=A0A5N6RIZ1_9ROSI|nr:hypothetical protein FH972_017462 [Carpinus fangiana]